LNDLEGLLGGDERLDPRELFERSRGRRREDHDERWRTAEERRAEIEAPLDPDRYRTLRRLCEDEDRRVVVGFGGGALPGLSGNLALARILEELSLQQHVEEVWGTSAGAVVGAGWATGTEALRILELVRSLDRRGALDFQVLRFALRLLATLWPFRRPLPDGLLHGRAFLETIRTGLGVETFEEARIPFRCIACSDDGRGTRKIFRRGPLLPAVFSSMALPGIVVPREGDDKGRCYYDGGLVEKTPLLSPIADHRRSGSTKRLLLLATYFGMPPRNAPLRGFVSRFLDCLHVMEGALWEYQRLEARNQEGVDLMLINAQLPDPDLFAFRLTDRNYLAARETMREMLDDARIAQTLGVT
jgi:hypothetical protein